MSGHLAGGLWSGLHLTWHINCLEMLAVFRALKHFLPDLRDHHVLVRTDNTAVVSYINHQGGLCSRPLYRLAHQLPGDAGRVSSTETLPPRPKRSPCVGAHRQHSGGLLHQPPGRSVFTPPLQAGTPDPCVVPGQAPLAESSSYSWASQYGSRHPVVAGAEARGMDASPRGGEADMESFWPSSKVKVKKSKSALFSILPHVPYIHTENLNCVTLRSLVHTDNTKH